jgi:hypothetical protein
VERSGHARREGAAGRAGGGVGARLAGALTALLAAGALLARVTYLPRVSPGGLGHWLATAPPEAPVLALATVAAYGCLAWLAFVLLAVAARTRVALPGRAFAERVLGVAAVTAAAGAIAAGPALADTKPAPFDRPAAVVATVSAGPFDRLAPQAPQAAPRAVAERDEVVVRRGDTLWGIAERHGGDPREWPRWYAANRAVIGADPHLILPGQRLVPPTNGAAR